jgi:hypothetical protein
MYLSQCLVGCKRWQKKRKEIFEVPDSSLVVFGTVSTGKRRLSEGEYSYIFRIEQSKNNGILFTKTDKH